MAKVDLSSSEWCDLIFSTIAKSKNSRPKNKMCH